MKAVYRARLAIHRDKAKPAWFGALTWPRQLRIRYAPMASLPRALLLALGQLGDRAILAVLVKAALITLAIFVALGWALWFALAGLLETYLADYASGLGAALAVLASIIGAWLLFRIVALFVVQFFADEVVRAVELRHYPHAAAAAREIAFREELANGLRAGLRALLANLAVLPFALLLLVTGIGPALLFWLVNAWLLGREFQDMVWLRHRVPGDETAPMGALTRFALGGVVAGLLAVPFVNLLAPVLGAASAAHLIHRRKGDEFG